MFEALYENIGGKIKKLAVGAFVVEAISAFLGGIGLMAGYPDVIIIGLLTMFIGPIVAWVSSWLLYAFGELVENSGIVAEGFRHSKRPHSVPSPVTQGASSTPVAATPAASAAHVSGFPQSAPVDTDSLDNSRRSPVNPENRGPGVIACPSCGQNQGARNACYRCGQPFTAVQAASTDNSQMSPVEPLKRGSNIACPKCQTAQPKDRHVCIHCGQPFAAAPAAPTDNSQKPPVKPQVREPGVIVCPSCGQVQGRRSACYKCNQPFC